MSTLRVSNISNLGGTKDATTNDISDVADRNDIAYAQVNKTDGQTMATGFDTILLNNIVFSKNISMTNPTGNPLNKTGQDGRSWSTISYLTYKV